MEKHILDFYRTVLPYGSIDLDRAINIALEVGEDGSFLGESVSNYNNGLDIDVVCCIYDTIFNNFVKKEILDVLDIDLDDYPIYVYGNYCATSFDDYDSTKEIIESKIKEIKENDGYLEFSEKVLWFFNEIDVTL